MKSCWITLALACSLAAQTRIDLAKQGQNIDFRAAEYTRPFKTGPVLPDGCVRGEIFFLTTAPAGEAIHGCPADDRWEVQGRAGILHVESGDTPAGTRGTVNFLTGAGLFSVAVDAETKVNVQYGVDTAVVLTRPGHQSGQTVLCASQSGSPSAYTCSLNPVLTGYSRGMVLNWIPDVSGTGGATTLAVDSLDPHPVTLSDGQTNPSAVDISAGAMYSLWFDGASFRMAKEPPAPVPPQPSTRPACAADTRGRLWMTPGGDGVKDEVAICVKDQTDSWQWQVLY